MGSTAGHCCVKTGALRATAHMQQPCRSLHSKQVLADACKLMLLRLILFQCKTHRSAHSSLSNGHLPAFNAVARTPPELKMGLCTPVASRSALKYVRSFLLRTPSTLFLQGLGMLAISPMMAATSLQGLSTWSTRYASPPQ